MIILDKPFFSDVLYRVSSIDDIKKSPNNSLVFFKFDLDLAIFCRKNSVNYAIITSDIKETIFAINLDASYIFCEDFYFAKEIQRIVEDYVLDTKVILLVDSYDNLEEIIKHRIDGIKLKENL